MDIKTIDEYVELSKDILNFAMAHGVDDGIVCLYSTIEALVQALLKDKEWAHDYLEAGTFLMTKQHVKNIARIFGEEITDE